MVFSQPQRHHPVAQMTHYRDLNVAILAVVPTTSELFVMSIVRQVIMPRLPFSPSAPLKVGVPLAGVDQVSFSSKEYLLFQTLFPNGNRPTNQP